MKGALKLLLGAAFGLVIGIGLGYVRLPMVSKDNAFWMGLATGAASIIYVLLVWIMSRRSDRRGRSRNRVQRRGRRWGMLAYMLLLGISVAGGTIIFRQSQALSTENADLQSQVKSQNALIAALKNEQLADNMKAILDLGRKEMAENDSLSEGTIRRMAALSESMQPYQYWEGDSLAEKALSPLRGQLLVGILGLELDSTSWVRVAEATTFEGADLKRVHLANLEMPGIDLRGADLQDANLIKCDLSGAQLIRTNLWGARLDSAALDSADMRRVHLNWAMLRGASLQKANLNGVSFSDAQMQGANLRGATFQWGKAIGTQFAGANMAEVDMLGTDLSRASFVNVNFSWASLKRTILEDSDFTGAEVQGAAVEEEDWPALLPEWRVADGERIQARYKVVDDTTERYLYSKYRLEKQN